MAQVRSLPPEERVRITYDVPADDGTEQRELPFVVGVLADFSGNREKAPLLQRPFIEVSREALDSCFRAIAPAFSSIVRFPGTKDSGPADAKIAIRLSSINDFERGSPKNESPFMLRSPGPGAADFRGVEVRDPASGNLIDMESACFPVWLANEIDRVKKSPEFLQLEASWRGLKYLADAAPTSNIKIRILDVSKKELFRDQARAMGFDLSLLFKKLHDDVFGSQGAEPFGVLIGDYEFSNENQDLHLLERISEVAAAIHAPFLAAATPHLLGLNDFAQLAVKREFRAIFKTPEYARWRSFRQSEAARYVCLTVPRVLLRQELPPDELEPFQVWGNAAFALVGRMMAAFARFGWCAKIRGSDGGMVTGLPKGEFIRRDGANKVNVHLTSAEVVLELWQEVALRDSGLVSFGYHRGPSDGFAFVATCQQTPVYESEEATVSHRLTADLRYVLAAGRFVHYLRAIVRDQPPGRLSGSERKSMLNNWIASYVSADAEQNPQRPLGAAYLDIAGPAGGLTLASFYALPKFQLEPLAFGFRTLFRLPPG